MWVLISKLKKKILVQLTVKRSFTSVLTNAKETKSVFSASCGKVLSCSFAKFGSSLNLFSASSSSFCQSAIVRTCKS